MKPATLYPKVAAALCATTADDVRRTVEKFCADQLKMDAATTEHGRDDLRVASWIHRACGIESALCVLVGAIGGAEAEIELRKTLDNTGPDCSYNHGPWVRQQAEEGAKLKAVA